MSEAVKLQGAGSLPTIHTGRRRAILRVVSGALAVACGLFGAAARAQLMDYIGPLPKPEPAPSDPRLPTGALLASPARPDATAHVCSLEYALCVHGERSVPEPLLLDALSAFERAYERLVLALGLPASLPDSRLGGSDGLDWYLTGADLGVNGAYPELVVGHDAPTGAAIDQASGFCVLNGAPPQTAELLDHWAGTCVAEASLLRLDASETPHLRRAAASELTQLAFGPSSLDVQALDDVQAHPERALVGRDVGATSSGASLLFEYLEQQRGTGRPGALTAALVALSAGKTPADAPAWRNEPDLLDVLRHSLGEDRPKNATLWGDLAVARAFVGSRDDGRHLPSLAWTGDFGRVRFDWSMKYSSLPRRVAATRPIEPTGSIYAWVELDEVKLGAVLGFQAVWESPVPFKWSLVRVDRDGREQSRVDVPFQERGSSVEARVTSLENSAALLVVGTNLGGVDLAHPLDPDHAPFEPQSCTIYLSPL